jgi:hypothetical protein
LEEGLDQQPPDPWHAIGLGDEAAFLLPREPCYDAGPRRRRRDGERLARDFGHLPRLVIGQMRPPPR